MRREEARLRELGLWTTLGPRPGARRSGSHSVTPSPGGAAVGPSRLRNELDWPSLEAAIRECEACGLCRTRRQAVPGSGSRDARLLVIGEAPGAEEDQRGEPFVGRAGELLDQMLLAIGLDRRRVYLANVLKCRPLRTANRPRRRSRLVYPSCSDRSGCCSRARSWLSAAALQGPCWVATGESVRCAVRSIDSAR